MFQWLEQTLKVLVLLSSLFSTFTLGLINSKKLKNKTKRKDDSSKEIA